MANIASIGSLFRKTKSASVATHFHALSNLCLCPRRPRVCGDPATCPPFAAEDSLQSHQGGPGPVHGVRGRRAGGGLSAHAETVHAVRERPETRAEGEVVRPEQHVLAAGPPDIEETGHRVYQWVSSIRS